MTKEQAFAREALRALQRYDEVAAIGASERDRMMRVQEDLGERLGIECSGSGTGVIGDPASHKGLTCPIHEWVEEADWALCSDREEGGRQPTPAL